MLFAWEDLGGERTASILTIVATCVSYGVNPRAYLHLVTTLIINRWPNAKLRELLPDRLAVAHPELLVQDGALRALTQDPPPRRPEPCNCSDSAAERPSLRGARDSNQVALRIGEVSNDELAVRVGRRSHHA